MWCYNTSMNTLNSHIKAEQLRESEQFNEALVAYDTAISEYTASNNNEGISQALLGKFLTYKHLAINTNDSIYLTQGTHCIEQSLAIIKNNNLPPNYRVYFSFGEAFVLQKEYEKAIDAYKQALHLLTTNSAERGNYQYHLGEALYLSGNTPEGEKELFNGLEEIQRHKNSTDSFRYNVWLSGVYLKIASLFWKNKQKVAKEHLLQAEVIINNDTRLVIRKKQLEKFKKDLY